MKKEVLKILNKELRIVHGHTQHDIHGIIKSADQITEMVMKFIKWTHEGELTERYYNTDGIWFEYNPDGELVNPMDINQAFDYWKTNIRK